ncbi:CWC16 protein [Scheffersomyces coipomensis]|uniref:CWC16 protein n=1 Tax=Scheffersomyces coipomensis TaxID=1788519 RepID=UPI00315D36B9
MSERKAINKYYPPDYDPSKIKPKKKSKTNGGHEIIKIRMMAPYSMRCLKCNEYIAERRSFNARKETTDEKYLNTKIIRFHITCPRCNNHISFKTNPQIAGYTPEEGAVRNYESKKVKSNETEDELLTRLEKEDIEDEKFKLLQEKRKKNPFYNPNDDSNGDTMENFEKRLIEQKKQQEIDQHLEELQFKNDQLQALGGESELLSEASENLSNRINQFKQIQHQLNEEEDEKLIQQAFNKSNDLKRKIEHDQSSEVTPIESVPLSNPPVKKILVASKITLKKKVKPTEEPKPIDNLASAIGGYSSSDDDED